MQVKVKEIKHYDRNDETVVSTRWWVFGNLKRVTYDVTGVTFTSREELEEWRENSHFQVMILNHLEGDWIFGKEHPYEVLFISIRDSDGEESVIAFDDVAYLCNDEGKTTERIRANHGVARLRKVI